MGKRVSAALRRARSFRGGIPMRGVLAEADVNARIASG
jgi:hypothetical protein